MAATKRIYKSIEEQDYIYSNGEDGTKHDYAKKDKISVPYKDQLGILEDLTLWNTI